MANAHNVKTKTTTRTVTTGIINSQQLRAAFGLPSNARVFIQIPGGGDWSGEDFAVSSDNPVHFEFVEICEE